MNKFTILAPIFNEADNIKLIEKYGKYDNVNIVLFDCNSVINNDIKDKFCVVYSKGKLFSKLSSYISQNFKEKIIITTLWNIGDGIDFNDFENNSIIFFNSNINYSNNINDFELYLFQYLIEQSYNWLNSNQNSYKHEFYQSLRYELLNWDLPKNIFNNVSLEEYSLYIRILNNESYASFKNYNEMIALHWRYINKEIIFDEIDNFCEIGINLDKHNPQIIVSLTSFPERIHEVQYCIYSLLNQKLKPDKIILWLAEEQFPNHENDLPNSLLKLKENGLTIDWCNDIKSYKKLIPALKKYPNDFIITVDDDIYYPKVWLEKLWDTYKKYPNTIISSRARSVKINRGKLEEYDKWNIFLEFQPPSYLNLPTGAGGTLYFPHALSETVFDEELFNRLCPTADDLWFWSMAVLNETKVTCVDNPLSRLTYVNVAQEAGVLDNYTLWQYNKKGHNDTQITNIVDYFPQILEIINDK